MGEQESKYKYGNPKLLLKDKLVVVTGGLSGTGAAISEEFCAMGAEVIAVRRTHRDRQTNAFVEKIRKRGGKIDAFTADITDPNCRLMIANSVKYFRGGKIDGLFHCAAVGLDPELPYQYINNVNNRAPLALTEELLPLMNPGCRVMLFPSTWSYYWYRENTNKPVFIPSFYERVAMTKADGENALLAMSDKLERKSVLLGSICSDVLTDTVAWHTIRNKIGENMEYWREGYTLSTTRDVATVALGMMVKDFEMGHVDFVGGLSNE